ncbi:MAG: hypothetical protein WBL65_21605 [Bryobacteraceae bacterium]
MLGAKGKAACKQKTTQLWPKAKKGCFWVERRGSWCMPAPQIIEVPAGLAEEAMERAVVFELVQLCGWNDAGEGAAAGTEDPGAGQGPEGMEARLSEARLKGEQEWGKGADQELRQAEASLSFILKK